jgi:hypothetical protein
VSQQVDFDCYTALVSAVPLLLEEYKFVSCPRSKSCRYAGGVPKALSPLMRALNETFPPRGMEHSLISLEVLRSKTSLAASEDIEDKEATRIVSAAVSRRNTCVVASASQS